MNESSVYFNIMKIVSDGKYEPTKIMLETNLDLNSINEILEILVNTGFIKEELINDSCKFVITNIGRNVLSYIK